MLGVVFRVMNNQAHYQDSYDIRDLRKNILVRFQEMLTQVTAGALHVNKRKARTKADEGEHTVARTVQSDCVCDSC